MVQEYSFAGMAPNYSLAPQEAFLVGYKHMCNQLRIQKIQKEGAEETDDAVLHRSGRICDQTLGSTLRTFQKCRKKGGGGGAAPSSPPPL